MIVLSYTHSNSDTRDHPHTTSDFRGGGGVSPNPMKSDDGGRGGLAKSDVGFFEKIAKKNSSKCDAMTMMLKMQILFFTILIFTIKQTRLQH